LPVSEAALTLSATEQGLIPAAHIPIYTPLPINGVLAPQAYRVILSGVIEAYLTNRGPYGTACSVIPWAICKFGTAVIASPNDHFIVPAGAPTAVNVDVTAASVGFNVQIKRTGSTAETVTVQDVVPTIS
jgi:hypothetical protein